ncbi:MAG: 4Fe-4S binding protein [Bacteroides sp.]|nr:4Fe-4S binding protein [Bacteroides sp.]
MKEYDATHLVFFSPTHTSAKIARAVGDGIGMGRRMETDLTLDESADPIEITNALTVIAAPVYGGRVAPVALKRLKRLKGNNAPAILIAVYGNRDYEDALIELRDTAVELGFTPLSAGAFIGEHSYSTTNMPIAAGRPDASDLQIAFQFGQDSLNKLIEKTAVTSPELQAACKLKSLGGKLSILLSSFFIKGTSPYKIVQAGKPACPVCTEACFVCGECVEVCPTHAISISKDGSQIETDINRCIKCCACVKECPNEARVFHTPFAAILHEKFNTRREPELFF